MHHFYNKFSCYPTPSEYRVLRNERETTPPSNNPQRDKTVSGRYYTVWSISSNNSLILTYLQNIALDPNFGSNFHKIATFTKSFSHYVVIFC